MSISTEIVLFLNTILESYGGTLSSKDFFFTL